MTRDDIRRQVLEALGSVAPEADLGKLRPEVAIRDQLDIDSMDFLNFVIAIHKASGVEIPEREYPKFATIDGCVDYIAGRLGS